MELRPYQSAILQAIWEWFSTHQEGNPIVGACVGSGKSVMIAAFGRRAMEYPETRILMLVKSKELCQQNAERLKQLWPQAPVGVYSASLKRKELGYPITYATIGSVANKAHLLGRIHIVMADECHDISGKDEGMYRKLISDLKRYNPDMRVIGWTGTPYRGDGVWLTDSEEPLFTHIAASVGIAELLEDGYLSPLVSASTVARIDSSGVKMRGGDFIVNELAERSDQSDLVQACAREIVELASDRKKWLVYCVTIKHAEHVAEALAELGVAVGVVSADTPQQERDRLISDFRLGKIRCLCNVAVLSVGFDVPEVDFLALLRSTRSPLLYVQIMGRGMRIASGKENCLVADFTDTVAIMGPVDAIRGRPRPKKKKDSEAPHKVCGECGNQQPAGVSVCGECGHEFPEANRIKHGTTVSSAPLLSSQVEPVINEYDITRVNYSIHRKSGSQESLRVDYYSGLVRVVSRYLCFGHTGYARNKALQWWTRNYIGPPSNAQLEDDPVQNIWLMAYNNPEMFRQPKKLIVNETGKYPEIVRDEY